MTRGKSLLLIAMVLLLVAVGGGLGFAYYWTNSGGGKVVNLPGKSTAIPGVAHTGTGCGVRKNANGTYTFSPLHVSSDGRVVDQNGCIVNLVGFNMGPLFLGDAVGGLSLARISWYKQTFAMNLVRVNFNSTWWDKDVFVPNANMHFRAWLQQVVQWQEQVGNYVELDNGPNYPEPPCGGTVAFCQSQDQGKRDYQANPNPTTALELETNIAPGVQAWTDLAKIYANDPAVIYDAWNEPNIKDMPTFFQDMNTLINTIRSQNPKALVVVFERGLKGIVSGQYPLYRQPNLVMDAHIYDGFNGTSPIDGKPCRLPGSANPISANLQQNVAFLHSHGIALMIGEWGGCYDIPAYHQQLTSFAKTNYLPLLYFAAGDVITNATASNPQVNDNGRLVQASYVNILGA
jgi:hypothetical protein